MIQKATFIHSDPEHTKKDKPRESKAKTSGSRGVKWIKKGGKLQFGHKLHSIIDRNY